jgi:hypothetical protein
MAKPFKGTSGEGRIKTQPGKFSIGGEGLCAGRDSGEAVAMMSRE